MTDDSKPVVTGAIYEAREFPGIPNDCCNYGVISHATGKEVCRVWTEHDAILIARLLNGERRLVHSSPDEKPVETLAQRQAREVMNPQSGQAVATSDGQVFNSSPSVVTQALVPVAYIYRFTRKDGIVETPVLTMGKRDWAETNPRWTETPLYPASAIEAAQIAAVKAALDVAADYLEGQALANIRDAKHCRSGNTGRTLHNFAQRRRDDMIAIRDLDPSAIVKGEGMVTDADREAAAALKLVEALDDAIATLAAVRATASGEEWADCAAHFYDLCGQTMADAQAALAAYNAGE